MTITINSTFIYYWIFTIIFESIYFIVSWIKFKKQIEANDLVIAMKEYYKRSDSMKLMWKTIFSPLGFFLGFTFICIVSPVMFLFSLKTLFKKLIGYKSKLEKAAEEERKMMEEADRKSKEWMKNEGCCKNDFTEMRIPDDMFEEIIKPDVEPREDNGDAPIKT